VSEAYAHVLSSAHDGVLADALRPGTIIWTNDALGVRVHGLLTGTWLSQAWNEVIDQFAASAGASEWKTLAWKAPIIPASAISSSAVSATNQSVVRYRLADPSNLMLEANRVEAALAHLSASRRMP
jgi:hypothetical protein